MFFNSCMKCSSNNYILKSAYISTSSYESWIKNILPKSELFYLKICTECGFVETYNAKIVDKNAKKNIKNTI